MSRSSTRTSTRSEKVGRGGAFAASWARTVAALRSRAAPGLYRMVVPFAGGPRLAALSRLRNAATPLRIPWVSLFEESLRSGLVSGDRDGLQSQVLEEHVDLGRQLVGLEVVRA